ncbi:MAG: DUF433 domain-containing protein [Cyanobacteria bacterium CRU_2_1]|nr:DUF433 domain-containing protein [Cyanobacteria bacterium CRU_2_1]
MQLEEYFDFLSPDDIRVKGTRMGIEHILDEYIHAGAAPEAIAQKFHSVTLEQIYATILYYLHNQETVGKYVDEWLKYTLSVQAEQDRNPPSVVIKLREWKAQHQTVQTVEQAHG